jgi:Fe-S-cluster containining protein
MEQGEWVTGKVVLRIGGAPLEMEMTVPANAVKPRRMLPIFQQMSNAFVELSMNAATANGEEISCKAGCGACCSQPVPIAEVEAYHIAELVESMPEPRRTEIKERFRVAVGYFSNKKWFDRMKACVSGHAHNTDELKKAALALVMEYFHENVPCPFLEKGSCSIYEARPLACREYLVTTPAENCSRPTAQTVKVMDLLVKPLDSLRHLGRKGHTAETASLMLVNALEFAAKHSERFEEKTGERWAAEFFGRLTQSDIPENGVGAAAQPADNGTVKRSQWT